MKLKWIGRFDAVARVFRLLAVTWDKGEVGDGQAEVEAIAEITEQQALGGGVG